MTELAVRSGREIARRRYTPERIFDLLGWDPFREMGNVGWPQESASFLPAFEVKETEGAFMVTADVPGVREQDLDVTLTGNRLTVSGKRDQETRDEKGPFYAYERTYGTFQRSFTIPDEIDGDHTTASLKDGVLTIALAKKAQSKGRKIAITPGKAKA